MSKLDNMMPNHSGKVVHCKKEPYDVYIGRPTKWGNPFSFGFPGKGEYIVKDRETAIECYELYLSKQSGLLADLHELKGKTLGCWCAPLACHGDVLLYLANQLDNDSNE